MNQKTASLLAMLFCVVVFIVVGLFGYSRYRLAQRENAAFRHDLMLSSQQQNNVLPARLPGQLSHGASAVPAASTPPPEPGAGQ